MVVGGGDSGGEIKVITIGRRANSGIESSHFDKSIYNSVGHVVDGLVGGVGGEDGRGEVGAFTITVGVTGLFHVEALQGGEGES